MTNLLEESNVRWFNSANRLLNITFYVEIRT